MKIECIVCPRGCEMEVFSDSSGKWQVEGASCKRGVIFAVEEMTGPRRILTSTLPVRGGDRPRVSLRSEQAVLKDQILNILESIRLLYVEAPVRPGDVLVKDAAGTGVDLIATSSVERSE